MADGYKHEEHAGNHADVFKHTVFCNVLTELQKEHPEGIIVADTHAGAGVYDLSTQESAEYKLGIDKVLKKYSNTTKVYEIPQSIREYIKTTLKTVGSAGYDDFELYPGSPLLAQTLLRPGVDEHRLTDLYVDQVDGLNTPSDFKAMDCYDPAALEFLMPNNSDKHNLVLIDAAFKSDEEYGKVNLLLERILERNPKATVCVWIPFINGHRLRWSFATGLREIAKEKAKVGRYYANILITKTGLQGSAMLVCNPTPLFDDVVDPNALHWLAHVMNNGKDEYTVEQIMKKKKKKPLEE
jgi:23S rRNA (adenine2030-N6)-methyltransferase